jgi:hypothetical protein
VVGGLQFALRVNDLGATPPRSRSSLP